MSNISFSSSYFSNTQLQSARDKVKNNVFTLDANADGKISQEESTANGTFLNGLLSGSADAAQQATLFQKLDLDADGSLSDKELTLASLMDTLSQTTDLLQTDSPWAGANLGEMILNDPDKYQLFAGLLETDVDIIDTLSTLDADLETTDIDESEETEMDIDTDDIEDTSDETTMLTTTSDTDDIADDTDTLQVRRNHGSQRRMNPMKMMMNFFQQMMMMMFMSMFNNSMQIDQMTGGSRQGTQQPMQNPLMEIFSGLLAGNQ